jgi:hypothetical protein
MAADSLDVAGLLRELLQQQTTFGQQQAALLQLQGETVRLQRLLIERVLGVSPREAPPAPAPASGVAAVPGPGGLPVAPGQAAPVQAPAAEAGAAPAGGELPSPPEQPEPQPGDSPVGTDPPRLSLVGTDGARAPEPAHSAPASPNFRSARYLQPPPARPARPVTRQHVERVTRLYEAGDAAHLVLQFGEYKGCTLVQVAAMDPDYVRRLALTAQRPQVRAAARQLVVALEASEPATKSSRSGTRRVRADGR